ncbi:hypothetical protein Goe17_01800 [Bacillus phage vB_BsuM-Goe17]|nr:hypothetical protein Goe17_01800 [Bacillus phage vB_BsuM-Goe17]
MLKENQKVVVKWNPRIKAHYEELGYTFTKKGEEFEVLVEHLTKGSRALVEILCDVCKENTFKKIYKEYLKNHKPSKDVCNQCQRKDKSLAPKNAKPTYTEVKQVFKDKGYTLLSTQYINSDDELIYLCNVHGEQTTTWHSFKKAKVGCIHCSRELQGKLQKENYDKYYSNRKFNRKYTYETIKAAFEDRGFELLDTSYTKYEEKLRYICKKHRDKGEQKTIVKFVLNKEKHPNVCKWCAIEAISGENSHLWRGGLTSKNALARNSVEFSEWRAQVFMKDNYTCQACGDSTGGNLQAHHIENFAEHEDKRFDVDNGITLCKSCHDPAVEGSFHHVYGTRGNNREQLEEYIKLKRRD